MVFIRNGTCGFLESRAGIRVAVMNGRLRYRVASKYLAEVAFSVHARFSSNLSSPRSLSSFLRRIVHLLSDQEVLHYRLWGKCPCDQCIFASRQP